MSKVQISLTILGIAALALMGLFFWQYGPEPAAAQSYQAPPSGIDDPEERHGRSVLSHDVGDQLRYDFALLEPTCPEPDATRYTMTFPPPGDFGLTLENHRLTGTLTTAPVIGNAEERTEQYRYGPRRNADGTLTWTFHMYNVVRSKADHPGRGSRGPRCGYTQRYVMSIHFDPPEPIPPTATPVPTPTPQPTARPTQRPVDDCDGIRYGHNHPRPNRYGGYACMTDAEQKQYGLTGNNGHNHGDSRREIAWTYAELEPHGHE